MRIVGGGHEARLGRADRRAGDRSCAPAGLDRIVEHNVGDLTAILEAGVPLAPAQETFAAAGQMLALDPRWLGTGQRRGDDRRRVRDRATPARCATATARRGTWSSG